MTRESPIGSVCVIAGFVGVAGLVFSGFMLRDSWRDNSSGSETPQQITLDALLTSGPGANHHMTVSQFVVANQYVRRIGGAEGGMSYLVLTPQTPTPQAVHKYLVVEVPGEAGADRAAAVARAGTITGMYSTGIGSTSRETRELLEAKNPGLDVWNAPFLEVREFRGAWYTQRLITSAVVSGGLFLSAVLTLVWFVRHVKQDERRAERGARSGPKNDDQPVPGDDTVGSV